MLKLSIYLRARLSLEVRVALKLRVVVLRRSEISIGWNDIDTLSLPHDNGESLKNIVALILVSRSFTGSWESSGIGFQQTYTNTD